MAEVTVSELAKVVGIPADRLLKQMQEAGMSHSEADQTVSDEEKQQLLAYLRGLHGGGAAREPKKITLKRKTVSTLKAGTGRKTVNVEVRKKRTYVKRDTEAGAEEEAAPKQKIPATSGIVDDVEQRRQAAIESRRLAEEEARRQAEEARVAAQQQLEEQRKAQETASKKAEDHTKVKLAEVEDKHEAHKVAKRHERREEIEDKPKKKTKIKEVPKGPHKARASNLAKLVDDEIEEAHKVRLKSSQPIVKIENKHVFKKPTEKIIYDVEIPENITVGDLAQRMSLKSGVVIKELMKMGTIATINEAIDQDTAVLLVEEFGHNPIPISIHSIEEELIKELMLEGDLEPRAPVVTVMGHVDHGKTSLLDHIRKTRVASGEAGGITQHIGAYHVDTPKGMITFLDTPGHAAFTAMRARGARSTDVVVLVVAADDGVMPQTEEAIQHSRAAGVPIVVAINKIDKEDADPDRVTSELASRDVIPEDWGGEVQFVKVSAHTGEGIDELLDAILLQSEMLELAAPKNVPARGVIVEARVEKGRGVVATALVQAGVLKRGDFVLAGETVGKIRALSDETGKRVDEAGPSIPVEILGLDTTPAAGDEFVVVSDERKGREIAEYRTEKSRVERTSRQQVAKMENIFASLDENEKKILSVVVKADVRGSLEAIVASLANFESDEVGVRVVASGVGGISESEVNLALTTGSVVIGFNVRADAAARRTAEIEAVDVRYYSVIYNLLDDVKQALSGMLSPEMREEILGIAEVRDVFRSPKYGSVAGCMVTEGTVYRSKPIRVLRDNVVIFEGELESLRRFKDDVNEVRNGMECGIGVKNYNDVQIGDQIEVFNVKEVAREL